MISRFEEGSNYSSFIGQPRRHEFGQSTAYSIVITGYLVSARKLPVFSKSA